MTTELIHATYNRAIEMANYNISHTNIEEWYKFVKWTILDDKSLINDVKSEAIRMLTGYYNRRKLLYNIGTKRVCENCQFECLATLFCEFCVRNYLKTNF